MYIYGAREFPVRDMVYRIWRWRVDAHVTLGEREQKDRQAGKDAGVGMREVAPKRFSSGSLRPFSFRRVASFSPWLPWHGVASHSANSRYEGRLNRVTVVFCSKEGRSKNGERITYVWEKTGDFGIAQKRLRHPIIISRGDTPF